MPELIDSMIYDKGQLKHTASETEWMSLLKNIGTCDIEKLVHHCYLEADLSPDIQSKVPTKRSIPSFRKIQELSQPEHNAKDHFS